MNSQEFRLSQTGRSLAEIAEQLGASAQQLKQLAQHLTSLRRRLQRGAPSPALNTPPTAGPEQV